MQIGYTKMNMKGTLWVTVVCLLIFPIRSLSQDNIQLARADSLYRLGRIEYNEERYESAISYFEQAIEAGMNSESSSALIASGLTYTGQCYEELEDYDRALDFFQRGADIWKKVYGEDSFNYVVTLYDIGRCYGELQNYKDAIEYSRPILSYLDTNNNDDVGAEVFHVIGYYYAELGDYANAIEYMRRGYTIRERVYGKENPYTANSLNNIGLCYNYLGDFSSALKYFQQALVIREEIYGTESPQYAQSLSNIAGCYVDMENPSSALEYEQQALTIRERVFGKEHPDYAISLNGIGRCYKELGEDKKALEYCIQALTIREKIFGKEHPEYAISLNNVALCYNDLGDHVQALKYYQMALDTFESVRGKNHPLFTTVLNNLGACFVDLGDFPNASKSFKSFFDTVSSRVVHFFSSLTESERALLWQQYSGFYTDDLNDFAVIISVPEMNCTAYDGALLCKGLLLNAETEMRKLILESGDKEALQMYNEVQQSRIRLDKIYADPVGKKELIDSLNNNIEVRQQELMKRSKAFGDYTRNLALKWTDVQAALGKKDIAIEFETYTHQDTTFYIALTLRPGYTEPHLVELFNSTQMKAKSDSKTYYTSTAMSELVWGNLADELNGVKNVYFSPAGELNNIGIEYMLDEDGKHLLSEKRNYYRLTSTRELAKEHQSKKMSDATVYGGIRYDVTPGSKLTGEETESERLALAATRSYTPMDSLSLTRGGWKYLPGTKEEAESISSTLTSKRVKNELLEGEAGTEESFNALGGARKDVIHIATHGFYWTETEAGRSGMETSSFMLDGESRAPKEDKALTRSGLLFAGAQNAFEGKDIPIDVEDGILTAKDISRMDLRGTDLVVISACQSGLGEVTGDGVFGLQRGFKKAGVQSIVMSLWEVDDTATKIMMTRFYENLAKGKSKYDSFLEAQRYLRKYDGGLYDEPEYYAAFVLLDAIK